MHSMGDEKVEDVTPVCEARFIDDLTAVSSDLNPHMASRKGRHGMRKLVLQYVAEAKRFGLNRDYAISRYTDFRFSHGDALLTHPKWQWLRDILQYQEVAEEEKIRMIDDLLGEG